MKVVVQRARNARCIVKGQTVSKIDNGLLVLVGFTNQDTEEEITYLVKKIVNLRIFANENQVMDLSVKDVNGQILCISQFTLYANTKKGNRPSYVAALNPQDAKKLYDLFLEKLKVYVPTKAGVFGAHMDIEFTNDGPVTIIMER